MSERKFFYIPCPTPKYGCSKKNTPAWAARGINLIRYFGNPAVPPHGTGSFAPCPCGQFALIGALCVVVSIDVHYREGQSKITYRSIMNYYEFYCLIRHCRVGENYLTDDKDQSTTRYAHLRYSVSGIESNTGWSMS